MRPYTRQRGGASLLIVLMMLVTMMLTAAYANRGVLFEQKTSGNQYRAVQAEEAADAALDWALAQLNAGRVDAQCMPSGNAADTRLRDRTLVPVTANGAGVGAGSFVAPADFTRIASPACVRNGDGSWRCTCPAAGQVRPVPQVVAGAQAPAFTLKLQGATTAASPTTTWPGLIQISAQGCAQIGVADVCENATASDSAFAAASIQAALVPALATLPAATLTATGQIDAGNSPVGLHNSVAPGSGLAAMAGGATSMVAARIDGPPGTPPSAAVVDHDAALAARSADKLMLTYLGMPEADFKQLPGTAHLHCAGDCTAALRSLVDTGVQMVWIDGDLTLSDGDIGSATSPLLLVADGTLAWTGNVRLCGFAFAHGLQWSGGIGGSAWLRGAAVVFGDATLGGSPDLSFDAGVLGTLHTLTGTYVRVPGSWTDS